MIRPNVSYCEDVKDVHYNPYVREYDKEYFTTVALEDGTISFNIWKTMSTDLITSISYSTDNGNTWITTQNQNDKTSNLIITINVNEGDKVLWKGDAQQLGFYNNRYYVGSFFSSTCSFDAMGNVMSLIYGDDFVGETTIENKCCFSCLFSVQDDYDEYGRECLIVNANNLVLPATTLSNQCYAYMFSGCTSLTSAPQLPATTVTSNCYEGMFKRCTSLTSAPQLPATTLPSGCYAEMFSGCTSLTTAPELPATTLEWACYYHMFDRCESLTIAPELPATTLAVGCYSYMFNSCGNLNYIKAMFTTTPNADYTDDWVSGVARHGTFVKNSAATWTKTGVDGIPYEWTVETASE